MQDEEKETKEFVRKVVRVLMEVVITEGKGVETAREFFGKLPHDKQIQLLKKLPNLVDKILEEEKEEIEKACKALDLKEEDVKNATKGSILNIFSALYYKIQKEREEKYMPFYAG